MLALRTQGWMLREIAEQEGVSTVRIHQFIVIALQQLVAEPGEELRRLEQMRARRFADCGVGAGDKRRLCRDRSLSRHHGAAGEADGSRRAEADAGRGRSDERRP